jgi:putative aminopeptidase FrvX
MTDILPFLKELIAAPGLSGYEAPAAKIVADRWRPLVDELSFSRLGSLHGLRRGTGKPPRPTVMIATHMDAIGLMVTSVVDGFLHVTSIGGVDGRVLPGARVNVHGRQDLPGVVVQPPARLLPPEVGSEAVPLEHLLVDTGLPPVRLAALVRTGDLVSFANPPVELSGETLSGHSLDNRASVAALSVCLDELQSRPLLWDVWAVATVQEEVGLLGAASSTFQLHPSMAIVVDVSWAKGPGASDWNTIPLDKGPSLTMGPNIHPALYKAARELADRLEIPYSLEYTSANSGTDAVAVQTTAEGIPTLLLGLPLRYMHTPVEIVAVKDIQRAGRLMAEFLSGLAPDFIDKITWDD